MTRTPMSRIALVSLGHFINDSHGNFLSLFLPAIVARLGLSLTRAGFLSSMPGIIHVFAQPVLGYLSDRTSRSYMMMAGPLVTALGASMLPGASSYTIALFFVALWGLGSATFHPQANGAIGYLGEPERLAFDLSLFSLAGMLGGTISPLYGIILYKVPVKELMPFIALIPVLITSFLFYRYIPVIRETDPEETGKKERLLKTLSLVFLKITPVWALSYARDITLQSIRFLIPMLIASRGGSMGTIGVILFTVTLSSAIMPLAAGKLSLSMGKTRLTLICIVASPCFLVPAVMTRGIISVLLLMAGNGLLEATNPLTIAQAQELAPDYRSVASSLIMGLCWGLGGFTVALVGLVADHSGIIPALLGISLLPLVPLPYYLKKI